jgi:uncharacterized protein (DUF849 family)
MTPEEKVAVVSTLKPELASFNIGSMNYGVFPLLEKVRDFKFPLKKPSLEHKDNLVFTNTFKSLTSFGIILKENATKPELRYTMSE